MHPHLEHIHLWFQHKADSDGAFPVCPISSNMPEPDNYPKSQTSSKSCQMCANDPPGHKEKLQAPCCSNFQKRNDQLARDVTISTAIQLHCLPMTLLSNSQNLQKVETDIVIFNGNVLNHSWHTWCKKGTNGKRMSCSLLICYMQIFKSIDFRTMGLWKLITFILIHTVYWQSLQGFSKEKQICIVICMQGHVIEQWIIEVNCSGIARIFQQGRPKRGSEAIEWERVWDGKEICENLRISGRLCEEFHRKTRYIHFCQFEIFEI